MQTVSVPWSMWYGEEPFDLTFPDSWDIRVSEMVGGPDIGDAGIRDALGHPIGAPRLRDLAQGRRDAAIIIDDLTRPTPSYRVLPYILEELAAAGLGDDRIKIVCAIAAHRPLTRPDLIKKIGLELVERLHVINHNAMDNLEFYGISAQGIPISVNRDVARADLKIAAGMITPRGSIFGGGAKLLLPGAAARQTIFMNHSYCPNEAFREHIEDVGEMVGLDYIVNPLLNGEGEIMAMVAGAPREAYWHGVEIGKRLYKSKLPESCDIILCNAWPKDTEGTQAGMGFVPLYSAGRQPVSDGGSLVLTAGCPEGLGFHSVMGPGTLYRERSRRAADQEQSGKRVERVLFSPGLNHYDAHDQFREDTRFFKTWPTTISYLQKKHGDQADVWVYPCGAIQYGGE